MLLTAVLIAPALAQQAPPGMPPRAAEGRPLDQQPAPAPIQLNAEQQAYLDRVLAAWEAHTAKIKTFRCTFVRWQYDPAFAAPKFKEEPGFESNGELKYSAPDKGTFKIGEIRKLNPETGNYEVAKEEVGEHWVSTGESIYEYNSKRRQVIERPIPPEMQGKAISDGPLPFLFGAEAEKLKKRYFLQIITPENFAETEIWVDAFPRWRHDAANFKRAVLRLKRESFEPFALRIYDPGGGYTSYEFQRVKINDPFEKIREVFAPPKVPFGWTKVLELPPENNAHRHGLPSR